MLSDLSNESSPTSELVLENMIVWLWAKSQLHETKTGFTFELAVVESTDGLSSKRLNRLKYTLGDINDLFSKDCELSINHCGDGVHFFLFGKNLSDSLCVSKRLRASWTSLINGLVEYVKAEVGSKS